MESSKSDTMLLPLPEMPYSLEELFPLNFGHSPTFLLINLMEQKVDVALRHSTTIRLRAEDELRYLEMIILLMGGSVRGQPQGNGNYQEQIPLIFVTNDEKFNSHAFRAWQEQEIRSNRKLDAFHEDFIMEVFHKKHLVDLREYMIGDSMFEDYEGNKILSQGHDWTKLKLLNPADSNSSGDEAPSSYRRVPKQLRVEAAGDGEKNGEDPPEKKAAEEEDSRDADSEGSSEGK